jgi:hypothetical protein
MPSVDSTTGKWTLSVASGKAFSAVTVYNHSTFACHSALVSGNGASCLQLDVNSGDFLHQFNIPWDTVVSVQRGVNDDGQESLVIEGRTDDLTKSGTLFCRSGTNRLICKNEAFSNVYIAAATLNPSFQYLVSVGNSGSYPLITSLNAAGELVWAFTFSSTSFKNLKFTTATSITGFVGSFVAGSAVSTTFSRNYIVAGWIRSDAGLLNLVSIVPKFGLINNVDKLVTSIVGEATGPDLFVGGGLDLADGSGVQGYVVRVNVLFRIYGFGVRYRSSALGAGGTAIQVQDMVLSNDALFIMCVPSLELMVLLLVDTQQALRQRRRFLWRC